MGGRGTHLALPGRMRRETFAAPFSYCLEGYFIKLVMMSASLEAGPRFLDAADLHVTRQQGLHVTVTLYHWCSSSSPRSWLELRWEGASLLRTGIESVFTYGGTSRQPLAFCLSPCVTVPGDAQARSLS